MTKMTAKPLIIKELNYHLSFVIFSMYLVLRSKSL